MYTEKERQTRTGIFEAASVRISSRRIGANKDGLLTIQSENLLKLVLMASKMPPGLPPDKGKKGGAKARLAVPMPTGAPDAQDHPASSSGASYSIPRNTGSANMAPPPYNLPDLYNENFPGQRPEAQDISSLDHQHAITIMMTEMRALKSKLKKRKKSGKKKKRKKNEYSSSSSEEATEEESEDSFDARRYARESVEAIEHRIRAQQEYERSMILDQIHLRARRVDVQQPAPRVKEEARMPSNQGILSSINKLIVIL